MLKVYLKKQLSLILALAVFGAGLPFQLATAARPDSLKDVVSDSRPSTVANHTITLDQASSTQWIAGETVILSLNSSTYDTSGFANSEAEDFDVVVGGTEESVVANGGCASNDAIEITTVNTTTDTFTFTACGSYTAATAGTAIVIEIGTNATSGSAGNDQITNATSATTTTLTASGTYGDDSQDTILVTTSGVTVSATIDEALSLTVAAVVSGSCTTSGGTAVTSTATTIPFGTIATEAFYNVCQELTVATNAASGYTVTVQTAAGLDAGAYTYAVGSCDGSCTLTTPNTWATATNNGYAVCMDDTTGNAAATANAGWDAGTEECGGGASTQKFILVADAGASETAPTIMSSATAVTDVSLAGWRISASDTQQPGAYTGTAIYVTTGTF